MASSHWSCDSKPIHEAVRMATGKTHDSQSIIYNALKDNGIDFTSVADFGCGRGAWLRDAVARGVDDIRGYDIPEINVEERLFPKDKFIPADLTNILEVDRRFDLVVSTEVAEHIDVHGLTNFVKNLCAFGDIILFSGAVPYQGGMGHCNENWMEYWVSLFREEGYDAYDFLRTQQWNNPAIAYYFRQNIIVFAASSKREFMESKGLSPAAQVNSYIHPELYMKAVNRTLSNEDSKLVRDVDIYYSHVRSFQEGIKPTQFDFGYGQEKLDYEAPPKELSNFGFKNLIKKIIRKII